VIEKEFRALLPLWAVCVVGLLATALDLPLPIRSGAAAIYILSCATLGAYAFGHEYVHGTMPMLLAQPIARSRIYLIKLGVLALMMAALRSLLFVVPFPEGRSVFASLVVPLPILALLPRQPGCGGSRTEPLLRRSITPAETPPYAARCAPSGLCTRAAIASLPMRNSSASCVSS